MPLERPKNRFLNNVFWNLFDCNKKNKKTFFVNISEETLNVTTAINWKVGTK